MKTTPNKETFKAWADQDRHILAEAELEFEGRELAGLSAFESSALAARLTSKSAKAPLLPSYVLPMV